MLAKCSVSCMAAAFIVVKCPALVSQRCVVEQIAAAAPAGHVPVHGLGGAVTVGAFEVVGHLVDDDVLQAVGVLLGPVRR